ncbi:MAG: ABC transporter substrate-binding protein [Candidatus Thorarchaeota archaeon]
MLILVLSPFISLGTAESQGQMQVPGSIKNGPYVDRIVFDVILQDDQRVVALLNDEIDIIGEMIEPDFVEVLRNSENIAIDEVPRNGYGYMVINCAKYPFNITAFRRALAFAVDKNEIVESVFHGYAQPLDSCIPRSNPFTVEGQLSFSYYEGDIVTANQLLDAAGFADIDDDNIREAPDGSDFDVIVESIGSSGVSGDIGEIFARTLRTLGVDAVHAFIDYYEWVGPRLYSHGDFDMFFGGSEFYNFDVDWLANQFWSENADEPYYNYPAFRNESFDSWRNQLLTSITYDEVYEAAIEMQRIWVYESPMIVCYENTRFTAYRNDRFTGIVNDAMSGAPGWWTNYRVHLNSENGGPWGGTFRTSINLDIADFNVIIRRTQVSKYILGELYDSLLRRLPSGELIPWLAESLYVETHLDNPTVQEGQTRFTFDLVQNATWSDGSKITAVDVAHTLNYYRFAEFTDENALHVIPFRYDLASMTTAIAATGYRVIVQFNTTSWWHLSSVALKPILSTTLIQELGTEGWHLWSPDPLVEGMITSGPFNISDYDPGEYIEMESNPNYFFGHIPTSETTEESTIVAPPGIPLVILTAAISGAVVVLIVGSSVLSRVRMTYSEQR